MFRKILSKFGYPIAKEIHAPDLIKKSVSKTSNANSELNKLTSTDVRYLTPNKFKDLKDDDALSDQDKAHVALRDAVKELSEGTSATPQSLPPTLTIQEYMNKNLEDLSIYELEQLARAYHEGVSGTIDQNSVKAVEIWKFAMDRGSKNSSYSYAVSLRDGVGVERNFITAFEILKKLADEDQYNIAYYAVGLMLSDGKYMDRNDEAALQYFRSAARAGILPALYNIGNFHSGGIGGIPKNDVIALRYYSAGAEAGDPASKFTVGSWLSQGRCCDKDFERSFELQKEAADMGHPGATFNIGVMYEYIYTYIFIFKYIYIYVCMYIHKHIYIYKYTHINIHIYIYKYIHIGVMYLSAQGTTQDILKAVEYFNLAVNKGISQAAVNVGNMYRDGIHIKKDLVLARSYYAKFAETNKDCKELMDDIDLEINSNNSGIK
jgi:TPR repeat protein